MVPCVHVFVVLVLFRNVNTSLGRERAGMCASHSFIYFIYVTFVLLLLGVS